jgi:hypothetical protein
MGQSFNVDLDTTVVGNGDGGPSDAFGAAAGSPGRWNILEGTVTLNIPLLNLNGTPSGATLTRSSAAGGNFAFNKADTSGDFAFLLDDAQDLSGAPASTVNYTFNGLTPGLYHVYTYAVAPDFAADFTKVTVPGSTSPNPQVVGGNIPPNAFAQGITHSFHEVSVGLGGSITITAAENAAADFGTCNGMQIVLVPEPTTLGLLLIGGLAATVRRRRAC